MFFPWKITFPISMAVLSWTYVFLLNKRLAWVLCWVRVGIVIFEKSCTGLWLDARGLSLGRPNARSFINICYVVEHEQFRFFKSKFTISAWGWDRSRSNWLVVACFRVPYKTMYRFEDDHHCNRQQNVNPITLGFLR